jgi:hypothetical protein
LTKLLSGLAGRLKEIGSGWTIAFAAAGAALPLPVAFQSIAIDIQSVAASECMDLFLS